MRKVSVLGLMMGLMLASTASADECETVSTSILSVTTPENVECCITSAMHQDTNTGLNEVFYTITLEVGQNFSGLGTVTIRGNADPLGEGTRIENIIVNQNGPDGTKLLLDIDDIFILCAVTQGECAGTDCERMKRFAITQLGTTYLGTQFFQALEDFYIVQAHDIENVVVGFQTYIRM